VDGGKYHGRERALKLDWLQAVGPPDNDLRRTGTPKAEKGLREEGGVLLMRIPFLLEGDNEKVNSQLQIQKPGTK